MSKERKRHHADFQSICARSTDIRGKKQGRLYTPTERFIEKKNITFSVLFNHVHTQSLITTVVFFQYISVAFPLFFFFLFLFIF